MHLLAEHSVCATDSRAVREFQDWCHANRHRRGIPVSGQHCGEGIGGGRACRERLGVWEAIEPGVGPGGYARDALWFLTQMGVGDA